MNIQFEKHKGVQNKDGSVIFYDVSFPNILIAVKFLALYPAGPDYKPYMNPCGEIYLFCPDP